MIEYILQERDENLKICKKVIPGLRVTFLCCMMKTNSPVAGKSNMSKQGNQPGSRRESYHGGHHSKKDHLQFLRSGI